MLSLRLDFEVSKKTMVNNFHFDTQTPACVQNFGTKKLMNAFIPTYFLALVLASCVMKPFGLKLLTLHLAGMLTVLLVSFDILSDVSGIFTGILCVCHMFLIFFVQICHNTFSTSGFLG